MKHAFLLLTSFGLPFVLGCGREPTAEAPAPAAGSPPRPQASPSQAPSAGPLRKPTTQDLFQAASTGSVHDVEVHLRRAPEAVRRPNAQGFFPLHLAADKGRDDVIEVLVRAGADVNVPHVTVQATPLQYAATNGHLAAVRALLDAGARVDAADRQGRTPLMWAASEGREPVVRALLERGADAKARTPTGWTALRYAEQGGHARVAELLRNREEAGR